MLTQNLKSYNWYQMAPQNFAGSGKGPNQLRNRRASTRSSMIYKIGLKVCADFSPTYLTK